MGRVNSNAEVVPWIARKSLSWRSCALSWHWPHAVVKNIGR